MNTEAQQDQQQDTGTSKEERFFGVSTPIDLSPDDGDGGDETKLEIEVEGEPTGQEAQQQDKGGEGGDEDDLSEYSERVQKRIKTLTWKAKEAERQQQAAQAERDEAFNVTQRLYAQNQQYEQVIHEGEQVLAKRFMQAAEASVAAAEAEYRQAYEEGDTDAVIEAQKKQVAALTELQQATAYEEDYQRRSEAWNTQQQQQQSFQPQYQQPLQQGFQPQQQQRPHQPSPEAKAWADENKWFGFGDSPDHRRDMTAVALATHETLVREQGMKPDTEDYYAEIDKQVRLRFPDYFESSSGGQPASETQSGAPSTVVAPASREAGGKPRKVKLSASQVALAKKLGITVEQYAEQLMKGQ